MRIALVLNDAFSMYHFRRHLIRALVQRGEAVYVIVAPGPHCRKLEDLGAKCIAVPMARFWSPMSDFLLLIRLYRIFREHGFDIVHNMTIKPNLYGTIAAAMAGVNRRVCLVSGIGHALSGDGGGSRLVARGVFLMAYRTALAFCHKVWFQNPEDMGLFLKKKVVERRKCVLIRGGGVSLSEYSMEAVKEKDLQSLRAGMNMGPSEHVVLMVAARMIWSKGVREFLEAANVLVKSFDDWRFVLLAPWDRGSPDSIPRQFVEKFRSGRVTVITEFREDVRDLMGLAEILVLPSYYGEGVPRSLLEGLAMGKPIVTTNHRGCRETVDEGKNGFLVPVRDSGSLCDKLSILMSDRAMRQRFGLESRSKAKREFDEVGTVRRVLDEVYGLA